MQGDIPKAPPRLYALSHFQRDEHKARGAKQGSVPVYVTEAERRSNAVIGVLGEREW